MVSVAIHDKCGGVEDRRTRLERWLPLLAVLAASTCWSLLALVVRQLSLRGMPTLHIIIYRGSFQLIVCVGIFLWMRRPARTWLGESREEIRLLCYRALFGFAAICFNFWGISKLPLAESQIIGQMLPVFSPIVAYFMLGERWYPIEFASAMLGVLGVVFIARPAALFGAQVAVSGVGSNGTEDHILGVACSLSAAISVSVAFVMVRVMGTRVQVHWNLVMFYQALAQVFLALPGLPMVPQANLSESWALVALVLLVGAMGTVGQILNTWGMQREKAATASLVSKGLSPANGFIFQSLFLPADPIYWTTIAGFLVALLSLMLVGFGKLWRENMEAQIRDGESGGTCAVVAASEGYARLDS